MKIKIIEKVKAIFTPKLSFGELRNIFREGALVVRYLFCHPKKFWNALSEKTQKWTLRGLVFLLIILIAVPVSFWLNSNKAEAAWWNDMWQYRKKITVTNSSGGALTNFQVKALTNVDLSTDITNGKVQADLDDLRFTDINGALLPYWIEDTTTNSVDAWVKMPSIPTTGASIYMYYGNNNASSAQNGNDVFEFFDDFSGSTIDSSKWTQNRGTFSLYSGKLLAVPSTSGDNMEPDLSANNQSSWTDYVVETRAYSLTNTAGNDPYPFVGVRVSNTSPAATTAWFAEWGTGHNQGTIRPVINNTDDSWWQTWSDTWAVTTWYSVKVSVHGTTMDVYKDGSLKKSQDMTGKTSATGGIALGTHKGTTDSAYFDHIFVRKYASTDPSAGTPAAEEKGTGPVAYWSFDEGQGTVANNDASNTVVATGGTITDVGGYRIHTFNSDGTFTVTKGGNVEVLVVAGGGGGGSRTATHSGGGGGGAGGLIYNASKTVAGSITVTVGAAGIGATSELQAGGDGGNSVFSDLVAIGGGGGGRYGSPATGRNGGSGGGAGRDGGTASGGTGTSGQGNNGGSGGNNPIGTGGGGGAGAAGAIGSSSGGQGGVGLSYSISGTTTFYAGGGGGGSFSGQLPNNGGLGGGGRGGSESPLVTAIAGTPNTGGGGGGGGSYGSDGGSGVVIVRYPMSYGTLTNMSSTASPTSGWQTEDGCIAGKCLAFDGSNDYIDTGNNNLLNFERTDSFSLSSWIKISNLTTYGNIIGKIDTAYKGWTLMNFGASDGNRPNSICLILTNTNGANDLLACTPSNSIVANTVYNITSTYNGNSDVSGVKIYINGVSQTVTAIRNGLSASMQTTSNTWIGRNNYSGGSYPFSGRIDEVKVYNYVRSAAQTKLDYNAGLAGTGGQEGASVSMGAKSQKWLTDGLVGHWKMDESSWGSVIDASGNGNNGTAVNGATVTAGKFGNGGNFVSSSSQEISVASSSSLSPTTGITIAMWVNTNGSSEILQKSGSYGAKIVGNKFTGYRWGGPENHASTTSIASGWNYLVATYDGAIHKTYVNGNLEASEADVGSIPTNSNTLYVGGSASSYINGKMDDVRIYNRALSPKEVSDLYNYAPGPVGYWKMDDASGITAADDSGNGKNGTLTNMDSSTDWVQGKYGGALDFDGSDDYVSVASGISTSGGITVGGWVNSGNFTDIDTMYVLGSQSSTIGYHWLYLYNSSIHWQYAYTSSYGDKGYSYTFNPGEWHYIVVSHDYLLGEIKFYVDGVLKSTQSQGTDVVVPVSNKTSAMGTYSGTSHIFKGKLDDVKVYNYARTTKQIVEDMNASHPAGGSPVGSQVGYWKFNEGYNITAYNSGNGGSSINGTLTNMASPATATSGWTNSGKFSKALNFDGSDDYVDTGMTLDTSQSTTITGWATRSTTSGDRSFMGNGYGGVNNGFNIGIEGNNRYWMSWADSARYVVSSASLGTGVWFYWALVANNGTATYYVNGNVVDTMSYTGGGNNGKSIFIGARRHHNSPYDAIQNWYGLMDEVKIYNYALTTSEIALDYNQGKSMSLGSSGTTATGTASNSADRSYCPPGDTTANCAPIAEWKLDENNGTVANDTSGNGNAGTITGATWTINKSGGPAVDFSGSSQYITITDNTLLKPSSAITVEAWFNARDKTAVQRIVSKTESSGYQLSLNENGACPSSTLCFLVNIAGTYYAVDYAVSNLSNNTWYYVSGVYNGSTIKLYLNGREVDSVTQSGSITQGAYPVCIGSETGSTCSDGGGLYFNGKIDDVKIYNYARSQAQIAWDYNRGAPVGWWKMDEGQGITANDSSGNNNSGTLTSMDPPNDWVAGKINTALDFDGSNDIVTNLNHNVNSIQYFSVCFWEKFTSEFTGHNGPFWISDSSSRMLFIENRAAFNYIAIATETKANNRRATDSQVQLKNGNWHNVCAVRNDASLSLYIDGNSIGLTQNDIYGGWGIGASDYSIGGYLDTGSPYSYWSGQLDDVRIYNYALTQDQIEQVYSGGAVNFR